MESDNTKNHGGEEQVNQVHEPDDDKATAPAVNDSMNAYLRLAAAEHGGSTDGALLDPDVDDPSEPSDPAW